MVTLFPGLFRNSYRYAWFAGSSTWVFAVGLTGKTAIVALAIALVVKLRIRPSQMWQRVRGNRWAAVFACFLVITVGGAGLWKARCGRPSTNRGPNIIFLGVDSVRPDHISALGYDRATTPNIDAFLQDAVRFDHALVPLCRTYPSWIAFLTACNPPRNGVRCNLPSVESHTPLMPTLAQHLKALGYSTSFLHNTDYMWFDPSHGFDTICEPEHKATVFYLHFEQPATVLYYFFLNNRLGYLYDRGLRNNAGYTQIYRPEFFGDDVVAHWRHMRQSDRFFAAVHVSNLEGPFSLSYPYSTYFPPPEGPVSNRFIHQLPVEEIVRREQVRETGSGEELEKVWAQEVRLYDALLRSSDDTVGHVLDGLKKAGLYDNSLIVLLSDHGENLFHNGLRYRYQSAHYGNHLWGDEDQRILLAIKFPRRECAGQVVKHLVRSVDVAPTVLDALRLPQLEQTDGVSLMPYI
jgi:arylsulfatase A-like enzyme